MFQPIVSGGPVMIPLLLCSVVALVIAIERWLYLRHANVDTTRMMQKIRAALERGSPEEARGVCEATPGPVARVLAATLAHFDLPKDDLREVAREVALAEQPNLDKHLPILSTIVTIAPLLGLLGHHLGADPHLPRGGRRRTRRAARPLRRHRGSPHHDLHRPGHRDPLPGGVQRALHRAWKRSSTKSNCASPNC